MATAAISCLTCSKSGCKLLLCDRCRNVWFCNRDCQIVARKELGHRGANCRADGAQRSAFSAAPSQPSTPMDAAKLRLSFAGLMDEGHEACFANTRIGFLAAVEKLKEAASVADLIGGMGGASRRVIADQLLSNTLFRLHDMDGAARAACSSLRAARASGSMSKLVTSLSSCGYTASQAPSEIVNAERASREQERLSGGSPSYGGLDLWQEGRISLPTTLAGLSRMGLAYNEAAVAICDAELAAAGGRGSPAADPGRVPSLYVEARARGYLGACLNMPGEEQRSLKSGPV